jgi:arginyl-tRNA synthetase
MNLLHFVQEAVRQALTGYAADVERAVAMVKPTQDPRHGDYQANCAMSLAKEQGKKPRDVAQEIVARLPLGEAFETPEIAGPGFINLRLRNHWIAGRVQAMARDERLGVAIARPAKTFVIDYSSPNVAKPMHVGHLRSTIIGDSLARLLRFLGHRVISDNHLGDWGTQFGMLLHGYKHFLDKQALQRDPVAEMLRLYVAVRNLIKPIELDDDYTESEDEEKPKYTPEQIARAAEVRDAARLETAKLHAGDPENLQLWKQFMPWGLEINERIYRRLDVHFDFTHGESFYNPMLADVVDSLLKKGIAQESAGAIAIFFGEGKPPALVRKNDGAFTYTTTDLATIRYRMDAWKPDALLYVVGSPQALHFQNLFEAARRWGFDNVELKHIAFGSVLGEDRKPLRTREGGVIELDTLLDDAVERAGQVYEQSRQEALERGEEVVELSAAERRQIVEAVGLGAVKYADLSQNRMTDYVFDWEKMLAMNGNTGTYMQYAYVRNRGIFRKGGEGPARYRTDPPLPALETPQERVQRTPPISDSGTRSRPARELDHERALALALLRFEEALDAAATEYQPNAITSYLWDLSKTYSGFFQNCPVLKAPTPELRQSRLLLCDLTARVIQRGLELLGIRTVERM